MRNLSNFTGGEIVLSDGFNTAIFKQSFIRLFSKNHEGFLNMGFNASLEVLVSFLLTFNIKINSNLNFFLNRIIINFISPNTLI
jgi:hypothetical protein